MPSLLSAGKMFMHKFPDQTRSYLHLPVGVLFKILQEFLLAPQTSFIQHMLEDTAVRYGLKSKPLIHFGWSFQPLNEGIPLNGYINTPTGFMSLFRRG